VDVVFGGGLWPLGWSVGFVERSLGETVTRYRAWRLKARFSELGRRSIFEALQLLLPFEMPYSRRLLVSTRNDWTAIFDNSRGGGDPLPPTSYLAAGDVQGVIATHIPPGQYWLPATKFHLLGPAGERPLHYVRTIDAGVFDSGRWEFEMWGEPQPFEETDAYEKRLVRDRFDRAMLLRYLAALGVDADDPDFYGDAVLVQQRGLVLRRWRASLEQARKECLGELPWS
jgi:hypothetical protein